MVNPGYRSKGCLSCRAMKVKCDSAQPSCGRCTRAGRTCPGRGLDKDNFRSMNTSSEAKVQHRVRTKLIGGEVARSSSSSSAERSLAHPRLASSAPRLAPPMSTDWIGQSVAHFFAEYVEAPDFLKSTWGFLEYLPDMYRTSSSIHLTEAVKAAALANMANTSSIEHLNRMARRSYGKALQDLGAAINDKARTAAVDTFVVLNILPVYEMITGERPLSELFHAHVRGQSAVIRMRGCDETSFAVGSSLFANTNRVLTWRDIVDRSGPYRGVTDWPASAYASPLAETSARLATQISIDCGRIRKALEARPCERDGGWTQNLEAIVRDALNTDRDVQRCFEAVPDDWRPWSLPMNSPIPFGDRPVSLSPGPSYPNSFLASLTRVDPRATRHLEDTDDDYQKQPSYYPLRIDIYPTRPVATLWNSLRCTHNLLLLAILDISLFREQHTIASSLGLPTPECLNATILTTVEDVCASIPFLLGDVDESGNLCPVNSQKSKSSNLIALLWTLHRLCRTPGLEPGLRAWIRKVLERIGTTGGMRQGLVLSRLHANTGWDSVVIKDQ